MFRLACFAFALAACDYASTATPRDTADTARPDTAETTVADTASGGDAPDSDPEPDCAPLVLADFRDHVWVPVFEAHGCIVCHRPHGLAGQSNLVLIGGDDDTTVAHDLAVVRGVALATVDGESVLLLRPTGRFPDGHVGGAAFTVDSPEYAALARFVEAATNCPDSAGPGVHAPLNPHAGAVPGSG